MIAVSPLTVAQVQLQFAPTGASYARVVSLPNGDSLLVGSAQVNSDLGLYNAPLAHWQMALASLGPVAFQSYPADVRPRLGGSGNDIPSAAAVDASGNIWIVGETDSDDFDLVNPIVAQKIPYRAAAFVVELDPTGNNLLFSTYLAGQQQSILPYFATRATAIAVDNAGNVYVGGTTDEPDFPTTAGAFPGGKPGADQFGDTTYFSFLVKISPACKLVYSTLLTTGSPDCIGSQCIGYGSGYGGVSSIAPAAGGAAIVAGIQSGSFNPGNAYVSSVAPDASKLLWTFLPNSYQAILSVAMTQDSNGNLDLFGRYASVLPYPGAAYATAVDPGLFAAKLKPDGSALLYSVDLGRSPDSSATGIVVDASGNPWLAGTSSSPQFPSLSGVADLGSDFTVRLDGASGTPQALFRFPRGVVSAPPALDATGDLLLPGAQGSLLTLPPSYAFHSPAIVAFANAASYALNTGLYPGALLTLYGFDLAAQSVQVTVNGTPAPILFAGANQINIQVPFENFNDPAVNIQIASPSGSLALQLPSQETIGLFTIDGSHAAALNQDGTVNSLSNPAAAGSIVSLFGTGAQMPSDLVAGAVATSAVPLNPQTQGAFSMAGSIGTIVYIGAAPGLINGVFQVNVQLPAGSSEPSVQALALVDTTPFEQTLTSNSVQVWVQ
jgi:uncharacterized protein (TIGR03437 family)